MANARYTRGFTLTELAVVLAIVGLLLGSMMLTFSVQVEQRNFAETQRRLEEAKELLLAFAVVRGRLPCPATTTSNGNESFSIGDATSGGTCTLTTHDGFLPAAAIGFSPVDASGYGLDAWNNRIRYAVSLATPVNSQTPRICRPVNATTPPVTPHFTQRDNLKANGLDCSPNDLVVCTQSQAGTTCAAGQSVTNQSTVIAVVLSTGKNGSLAATGANELENLDGDAVFAYRTPDPSGAPGGEYDDLTAWIPVGLLYGRLTAAGVLP
ncbi:MAG TPA: type II secretion system protein [Burkholderiales bacterium]|nr:type II secretion system protein [Burkholderiales bacterium]